MTSIDRRTFLWATSAIAAEAAAPDFATATESNTIKATADRTPTSTPEVTKTLACYIMSASYENLPEKVRKEGVRTLLNWVGVALGGSQHETVNIAVGTLAPFSGPAQATILGRRERFDVMNAAFVNGVSSHIFDFDDTHLKTIIHPAGPVVSAILALTEYHPVNGTDFLNALVLGVETECRIGNAVYPDHYDRGWHITGTAGVFGAAVGAGKLLGLSEQQMIWTLGLAASQPVGLRESFGSMNKSNECQITADQIERIDLRVNPLVLELTGKRTPHEGLEGKFSIYHAVAVAIIEGTAGEKQFSDQAVQDPTIIALRDKVLPVVDTAIKPEQVDMSVILKDGRKLHKYIEHAIGSHEVPMTNANLETKFVGLAEGILARQQIQELIDLCLGVERLSNAAAIAKAAIPA